MRRSWSWLGRSPCRLAHCTHPFSRRLLPNQVSALCARPWHLQRRRRCIVALLFPRYSMTFCKARWILLIQAMCSWSPPRWVELSVVSYMQNVLRKVRALPPPSGRGACEVFHEKGGGRRSVGVSADGEIRLAARLARPFGCPVPPAVAGDILSRLNFLRRRTSQATAWAGLRLAANGLTMSGHFGQRAACVFRCGVTTPGAIMASRVRNSGPSFAMFSRVPEMILSGCRPCCLSPWQRHSLSRSPGFLRAGGGCPKFCSVSSFRDPSDIPPNM